MNAQAVIEALGLVPHPEGGYFLETYRSGAVPMASRGATDSQGTCAQFAAGKRNLMTSIYWMPTRSSPIGWLCRNRSDHVHYFHAGSPVEYRLVSPSGEVTHHRLGLDWTLGQRPQLVVPGGYWKTAELVVGEFALIGEGVSPGFDFADFSFVSEDELRARLPERPELQRFVKPDQRRNFDAYYDAMTDSDEGT